MKKENKSMKNLHILMIISAGVFALLTVVAQVRLNLHTDAQAKFLIAAKAYNFSPAKSMTKRAAKYCFFAAALLFPLYGIAAVVYGIITNTAPDITLTIAAYGVSLAAYAANSALVLLCAFAYVKHKIRYTPIL